ncbi:mastermind-like protein 2 [Spea bombifrons]|uniref:mastermind-like protein 2 n=1 Tax=Spea bombifrons TaxID=233779 RepID=UPI00234A0144|nr:mastermind-like protein 2 [Spea bombifrons]XP_053312492.1 mastermind-like protein 2 [Spea bombifrons]
MGETAPLQPTPGSLGIGMGAGGLLGGGAVAPRVHSAIVERLRARIAACRDHHRNCQGRYERSRAESSDKERESTLQLLTLVQHGQGSRKSSKHSKSTPLPDYHAQQQHQHILTNASKEPGGEQQTTNGLDQRNSALIALQGSLKRRLVVPHVQNKRSNGITDNSYLDMKKIRPNGHLTGSQNVYHPANGPHQAGNGTIPFEQTVHQKMHTASSANCDTNDLFNIALKDIKKEPGENLSCSKHFDGHMSQDNMYRYGDDCGEQPMDPDLQELFNELTYISVPPMTDIELQNMINITIKQDEPFNIDLGQQNHRNTLSSTPLDKVVIKSEYPQGMDPTRVGSPQLRPSSTGPTFSMASSPSRSGPQNQNHGQVSSSTNRVGNWQELSHAQQLKQIAANRQHNLVQQHQPNQSPNWSNLPPAGASTRPYGQDKVSSPFRQQQLSPQGTSISAVQVNGNQTKPISTYLHKPGSSAQNNQHDIMNQQKTQDSIKSSVNSNNPALEQHHGNPKHLFHFSPNQANQQGSPALSQQNKTVLQYTQQQQQASVAAQQHEQLQQTNPLPTQNQPRLPAFQQKMLVPKIQPNQSIPGLHYSVHQQDQHSAATQGTGSSSSVGSSTSPSAASNYNSRQPLLNQQLLEKTNSLQRQMIEQKQQLIAQQQMLSGTEKSNTQDQLNRHMTRPPPDYKDQRRNTIGMQQGHQYGGGSPSVRVSSTPPIDNSVPTHITSQNSTNHGARMSSLQGPQNIYGNVSCPQQSMYHVNSGVNQIQQQTSSDAVGSSQNGHALPRPSSATQGNRLPHFGTGAKVNPPQFRNGSAHATGMMGHRPPNAMVNASTPQNWVQPEGKIQDSLCFSNNNPFPNQSLQNVMGNQVFPQRSLQLTNQPASGAQMRPLHQMSQANNGQPMDTRGLNLGQTQMRPQNLSSLGQAGGSPVMTTNTFTTTQHSRAFQGTDNGNDLGSFDFLSQNGNLGSSLNSDSDFIDALLKTGHLNDDWMKDINLDEIFKNHS